MKKVKRSKGQVLVVALALIVAFFMMSLVVIETGYFVFQKIHMQNTADSMAMESGIWYARSLNLASAINKIRYCTSFVNNAIDAIIDYVVDNAKNAIIKAICGKHGWLSKACAKVLDAGGKAFKKIAKPFVKALLDDTVLAPLEAADVTVASVQRQFVRNVPMAFVYGNALKTGAVVAVREQIYCLPCFVKDKPPWATWPPLAIFTDAERQKEKITYSYTDGGGKEVKLKEKDVEFDYKTRRWKKKSGDKNFVDRNIEIEGKTQEDIDIKNADMKKLVDQAEKDAAKQAIDTLMKNQTYIEETGTQQILVVCAKKYKPLIVNWIPSDWYQGWMLSASKVVVEGGSMAVGDLGKPKDGGGAQYFPKIVNLQVSEKATMFQDILYFIKNTFSIHIEWLDETVGIFAKVYH